MCQQFICSAPAVHTGATGLPCGTGACAVAVAAVENGFCTRGADIDVRLPGGTLVVRYQEDGKVWLTGDANTDFTGTIEI